MDKDNVKKEIEAAEAAIDRLIEQGEKALSNKWAERHFDAARRLFTKVEKLRKLIGEE